MIPGAGELAREALESAKEIRLRPGKPLLAVTEEGIVWGKTCLTPQDVHRAAQALSGYALAAWNRELCRGFLPLPGGHRLGVCGRMGEEGLKEIASLCLRIAHEVKGAGAAVFSGVRGKNTLLLGPPGSGKTTLLRDLARLYGEDGWQVGIADERGEVAACRDGQPMLDVGPMADVVTGLEKTRAIPLLLRAMAPQVIAVDELGGREDAGAVLEAIRCGVTVIATAHGRSVEQIKKRMGELVEAGAFEKIILLHSPGAPMEIREVDPCN